MDAYKAGQKVICNGNPDARIIRKYSEGMYEVRLFQGLRHVGDACVSEHDLNIYNKPLIKNLDN